MSEPPKTNLSLDRRCGLDRRRNGFPLLFSSYRRRKRNGRRKNDRNGYVDVYDLRSWSVALSVLILSLIDAFLTGIQIHGGRVQEANPIMNAAIRLGGIYSFMSLKAAMTALPLAIIMLHKEWVLARYAARVCLWAYILVAIYHLYLIVEGHSLAGFVTHLQ